MYIRFNSSCCKTFLVYLICLSVLFRPTFANASTLDGWSMSNPVAKGASTVYDATKNVIINGKKYIKESSVKITPNASQVAKVLARGGAGYALSVAVEQLIGAVDWILDPENNRVIYYPPQEPSGRWAIDGVNYIYTSGTEAARAKCSEKGQTYRGYDHSRKYALCTRPNGSDDQWSLAYQSVPAAEPEEKYLPLPTVAQQVISNAESDTENRAAAQVATTAAAADIVAEAETDDAKARPIASQAEANATTKPADAAEAEKANEAQGESKPNEANPEATDLSITFPIFCNWAPTICEAAQTVISFPQTLTNWWETGKSKAEEWATSISRSWTEAKEWSKEEEKPKEDDPQQIQEPDLNISVTNYIQFGSQCPQNREIPLSMGGQTLNLVISYQPLCIVAEQFRPAVILMAFLAGAFIITNTGRRAETGD